MAKGDFTGTAARLTTTLTTSLNSTAKKRMLTIHLSGSASDRAVTLDKYVGGATQRFILQAFNLLATFPMTIGPIVFGSTDVLRGGNAVTGDVDVQIDELLLED